ncbi:MAG: hypothetical protein ACE5FP_08450, partial [Gemmatimonadota bacterium]
RRIVVDDARLLTWQPPRVGIALTVSTGTYVRGIARDLGERLGCHAHLGALRRTRIGAYDVSHATAADRLAESGAQIVAPLDAVGWLRRREIHLRRRGISAATTGYRTRCHAPADGAVCRR